jgi:hypothetical protein
MGGQAAVTVTVLVAIDRLQPSRIRFIRLSYFTGGFRWWIRASWWIGGKPGSTTINGTIPPFLVLAWSL